MSKWWQTSKRFQFNQANIKLYCFHKILIFFCKILEYLKWPLLTNSCNIVTTSKIFWTIQSNKTELISSTMKGNLDKLITFFVPLSPTKVFKIFSSDFNKLTFSRWPTMSKRQHNPNLTYFFFKDKEFQRDKIIQLSAKFFLKQQYLIQL